MKRQDMNKELGLTEAELDAIANEYEADTWDASQLGKVKMGRPTLYDAPMKSVTFKESGAVIEKMDERATKLQMSRSDYIRGLIERDLALA